MKCFAVDDRGELDGFWCSIFLYLELQDFTGLLVLEEESLAPMVPSETEDLNRDLVFSAAVSLE